MLTIDDLAEIDYLAQEAIWQNYEETPQELKDCNLVHVPFDGERLTFEQVRARHYAGAHIPYSRIPDRRAK